MDSSTGIPNLFIRQTQGKAIYYVRKMVRGTTKKASTGIEVGGDRERKRAIAKQRDIEAGWDKGLGHKVPTWAEYWDDYYQAFSLSKSRPVLDEQLVAFSLKHWSKHRLDHITPMMAQRLLTDRLEEGVAQGTVTRMRSLVQAIFRQAIRDKLLIENPFAEIKRVPYEVRKEILSWEDEAKLRRVLSPQMERWLTVMLMTGLRLAEMTAVRPEHMNRKTRQLAIQAEAAKGGKARVVYLYPEVEAAIDEQIKDCGRLWDRNPSNYQDMLRSMSLNAKIDHITPHTLRHTFATRFILAGGKMLVLSKTLGHANIGITIRQYVHLEAGDIMAEAAKVDLKKKV